MAPVLVKNLERRRFEAYYCGTREEAADKALSLMPPKSSVSWGGSVTLEQCGLIERVRGGPYKVLDRADAGTPEEREDLMRRAMSVDFFLTSFNGISMDGRLVNVDGTGNRVAATIYGPRNVIAVVGMNKVCMDGSGALGRSLGMAAQLNAARFGKEGTLFTGDDITADCQAEGSICNVIAEIACCKPERRIKVILVGEDLGF